MKIESEDDLRQWLKELLNDRELHRVEPGIGTTPGFPDLIVPVRLPGVVRRVGLPVELKVWHDKRASVRPAQRAFHARAALAGDATAFIVAIFERGAFGGVYFLPGDECPMRSEGQVRLRLVWRPSDGLPNASTRAALDVLLQTAFH